ncbi:hypothetical protein KIW84_022974 [Lathyrus oleraceus]|uniref:Uncharacterized protein n=1 Tax=Pisum sativum TaxID=3888 RepID=A0A9D4YBR4_PEA|nr:hypothetical protein KIW84_022974 [Pisum sativum]
MSQFSWSLFNYISVGNCDKRIEYMAGLLLCVDCVALWDILDVLLQADMMMIRVQARHVAGLMSMCTNNCGISKFALAKVNEDASGDISALQWQIQQLKGQLSFLTKNKVFPPLVSNLEPNSDSCRLSEASEEHDSMGERTTADGKLHTPNKEINRMQAALVGALRREKMAETTIQNLNIEIDRMKCLSYVLKLQCYYNAQNVPPAILLRFLREHRSEWADNNMDAYSAAAIKVGPCSFSGSRVGNYGGQVILPLAHTIEHEEFLEVIKLEGMTHSPEDTIMPREVFLLQKQNCMDSCNSLIKTSAYTV